MDSEDIAHRLRSETVGIDLGGTTTKIWSSRNETSTAHLSNLSGADETEILGFIRSLLDAEAENSVVGIALPCTMVGRGVQRRIIPTTSKFQQLTVGKAHGSVPALEQEWSRSLQREIFLCHDAEAACADVLATLLTSRSTGYRDIVVITLGTSLGMGLIFNGKVHLGPYKSNASHILLENDGVQCLGENHV